MNKFHITFVIESALTAKQQLHNTYELALIDPLTKWTGNELHTNDLNRVNANFSSINRITFTNERA